MLTIKNFKSSLLNSWWGGWKITEALEELHKYDANLLILPPIHYSITFIYYRADGSGPAMGRLLLERKPDEFLKGKYRYRIYLNGRMINSGGVSAKELEDRPAFIETAVGIIDCELRK
jgi:hypothetical protein